MKLSNWKSVVENFKLTLIFFVMLFVIGGYVKLDYDSFHRMYPETGIFDYLW